MKYKIIFFGSFGHYSAIVLNELLKSPQLEIVHVVTSAPFVDRKGKIQEAEVAKVALTHNLPTTTNLPESLTSLTNHQPVDFLITAGYGHLLPGKLLSEPKIAALNLHFSLLPKYRGANPGEWALLFGEKETGVSIIQMNEKFDEGGVLFSKSTPIEQSENRETLYEKLYRLGGKIFPQIIEQVALGKLSPIPQPKNDLPYASRFKRDDGFVSWELIKKLLNGQTATKNELSEKLRQIADYLGLAQIDAAFIERSIRALYNFPSLWTQILTAKGTKRMKIHTAKVENGALVLDEVQIEGQQKSNWNQVKNQVLT